MASILWHPLKFINFIGTDEWVTEICMYTEATNNYYLYTPFFPHNPILLSSLSPAILIILSFSVYSFSKNYFFPAVRGIFVLIHLRTSHKQTKLKGKYHLIITLLIWYFMSRKNLNYKRKERKTYMRSSMKEGNQIFPFKFLCFNFFLCCHT